MICSKCYNEDNFEIRDEREIICVRGEEIEIKSKVTYCKECGNKVWNPKCDDDNLKIAYNIYRKNHNLLQPEEITAIREKYEITQITFARVLGLGDKTITRYENGAIQDTAQNNLILLSRNINNFKILFEKQMDKLNNDEISKINEVLSRYIPKVISYENVSPLEKYDCYFGGFTSEEQYCQYRFSNAV